MLAGDPEFERLWRNVTLPVSVRTEPAGALVSFKEYVKPESEWERLGTSPIEGAFMPFGYVRWRFAKNGFEPLEVTWDPSEPAVFRLLPKGSSPAGMVQIPSAEFTYGLTEPVALPNSWLDVYEVTNRQFKEFLDRGGYRAKEHWKHPFLKEGRPLIWEQAMAAFRDSTGRPGPSTWELGSYPEGQDDFPVGGVSWYEAAAYADFAGKSLPTFHHWFNAAGVGFFSEILGLSNFGGRGPARVGSHRGLSPWGTYDMAGNVKEWVWNAVGSRRYTLGGGWNDAPYLFTDPNAADPFERGPSFGFRCARYDTPPPQAAFEPIEQVFRDYSRERPASDEAFATFARLYAYDPAPLEARSSGPDDDAEGWRMERVSFAAVYGSERIPARLYLPRHVKPPYQAVLYSPSGGTEFYKSIERFPESEFSFLVRSGRAVLFPVYQNTFERRLHGPRGPNAVRESVVQANKDARRALDYLASRPDIDVQRVGFYGVSAGASAGLRIAALDQRLRAVILVAAGLPSRRTSPEIDRLNFAPRVRAPVLIVNGRNDFLFPLEASQRPLLRLLGTPDKDKRLALFEGGHILPSSKDLIRETLDWLDRYLGPVTLSP